MENKNNFSFEQYKDPTGDYSNSSLKLASWYIEKKEFLNKILIFILLVWNIFSISFGIYGFSRYFFYDVYIINKNIDQMILEGVKFENVRNLLSPIELVFKDNKIFNSATDKYDFATKIFNPNEKWLAEVSYRFIFANGQTEIVNDFILPKEEKYLIAYGYNSSSRPNNFKIEILKIKWSRISSHKIPNVSEFSNQRLQFVVSDFKYLNISDTGNNFLQFFISNDSIFAFREVKFNVLFYANNNLVGISPIFVNNFLSKERKKIELTTVSNIGSIDDIKIETILNIFDNKNYLSY